MRGGLILVALLGAGLASPALAAPPKAGKPSKKIVVHKRHWQGYGFLPGYRPQVNNLDARGRSVRHEPAYEVRYWRFGPGWYGGQWQYGYGRPGFYRGRWNGSSFGPCWTQTPIGPMWNCGG
jgi:hypothetical protein